MQSDEKWNFIKLVQRLLRKCFGEYLVFFILTRTLSKEPCEPVDERVVAMTSNDATSGSAYGGSESFAFQYLEHGQPLCTCWVWYGERYKNRNFWPLAEDECKLIALETLPVARGRGLAPKVIDSASAALGKAGFKRIYARVWHSNKASLKAFRKAGWIRHAIVVELDIGRFPARIVIPMQLAVLNKAGVRRRPRTQIA